MSFSPLIPASLAFRDGVPYAEAFGDIYHSADGGLEQARYVFVGGNRLPDRWRGQARFVVLETGFGLGLNFLATWQAWRNDPARARQLHYLAIEKHPFSAVDLMRLHATWPELAELSIMLRTVWPPLVPGFHRLLLDEGRVVLTLLFGDVSDCLPQIDARVDAFYLDGFAPDKNPAMWQPDLFKWLGRLAAPAATLATYTVSAAVRHALAQAGFVCEKCQGFGRKREMLRADFAPRWLQPSFRGLASERKAIVIGAGLAGATACERLAARGWELTLIERHEQPAQEASGNPAGIFMPLISKDDNPATRLSRAAYLFALHYWQQQGLIGAAFPGEHCGVLQLARDASHAQQQRETASRWQFPAEFAEWLEAPAASALLGTPVSHGGWCFPKGGWVHPQSLCRALLEACGSRLTPCFTHHAMTLERLSESWQARDGTGAVLAEAPVVILASGVGTCRFTQTQDLPLITMRGQITTVPDSTFPALPLVVCREGYLTRCVLPGTYTVGATYDTDADTSLRPESQQENLARLAEMLPEFPDLSRVSPLAGRVGFRCVSPDRLPLVGALPDRTAGAPIFRLKDMSRLPGLYGLLGYASRGIIWAPLAAELLAAQLEAEPLPIERGLADALDPARFALKAMRRS